MKRMLQCEVCIPEKKTKKKRFSTLFQCQQCDNDDADDDMSVGSVQQMEQSESAGNEMEWILQFSQLFKSTIVAASNASFERRVRTNGTTAQQWLLFVCMACVCACVCVCCLLVLCPLVANWITVFHVDVFEVRKT